MAIVKDFDGYAVECDSCHTMRPSKDSPLAAYEYGLDWFQEDSDTHICTHCTPPVAQVSLTEMRRQLEAQRAALEAKAAAEAEEAEPAKPAAKGS